MEQKDLRSLFEQQFGGFTYPYLSADAIIQKLPELERESYAREIKDFIESKAYKTEMEGFIRSLVLYTVTKANTERVLTEVECYRIAINAFQDFDKRLRFITEKLIGSRVQTNKAIQESDNE